MRFPCGFNSSSLVPAASSCTLNTIKYFNRSYLTISILLTGHSLKKILPRPMLMAEFNFIAFDMIDNIFLTEISSYFLSKTDLLFDFRIVYLATME